MNTPEPSKPEAPPLKPSPAHQEFFLAVEARKDETSRIVLVVDDEPAMRKLIARDIKRADPGVLVVQSVDGREALEKLKDIRQSFKCDPVLIVLDLKLPILDGWEVLRALKTDYESRGQARGIPVIVLSSTSGEKGLPPFKHSIHGNQAEYVPLISVAKEACVNPAKYDAIGEDGLVAWVKHFLSQE